MKKIVILILGFLLIFHFCSSPNESNNNSPSDHTIKKDGVLHKSGLNNPNTNCVTCHGQDLRGGTSGVSCYSCHEKKW